MINGTIIKNTYYLTTLMIYLKRIRKLGKIKINIYRDRQNPRQLKIYIIMQKNLLKLIKINIWTWKIRTRTRIFNLYRIWKKFRQRCWYYYYEIGYNMAYTTFSQTKNDQLKEPMFFGQNVNVARYDQQKYETFEKLIEKQLFFLLASIRSGCIARPYRLCRVTWAWKTHFHQ